MEILSPKIVTLPAVTRPQELAHSRIRTLDIDSDTAAQENTGISTTIDYKAATHRTTTLDADRKMAVGIGLQRHSVTVL